MEVVGKMKKKKQYVPLPDCPNCGGIHFGQYDCPFTKEEGAEYKRKAGPHAMRKKA
jgi:hypothetical protein